MLGVPDAYELPRSPGHGLPQDRHHRADPVQGRLRLRALRRRGARRPTRLLAGPSEVRPFPASIAARAAAPGGSRRGTGGRGRPHPADRAERDGRPDRRRAAAARTRCGCRRSTRPSPSTSCSAASASDPAGASARRRAATARASRSASSTGPSSSAATPFVVDLAGAGGHVGVVGGPARQVDHAAHARRRARADPHPRRGAVLLPRLRRRRAARAADLPHVGGVAGRLEPEVVQRLVAEVATILEDRERRFREHGIDSMATYRRCVPPGRSAAVPRRRRVRRRVPRRRRLGHAARGVRGARGDDHALAARGLTFGVHVVLATNRWMDLRLAMRDIFGTRLELRLGDPIDSEIDRKLAATVPDRPGRGIGPHRAHFLVGVPRIDGTAQRRRPGRRRRGPGRPGRARLVRAARAAGPAAAPPGGARPAGAPRRTRGPRHRPGGQPPGHRGAGPARRIPGCCSSATRRAARPRRCARSAGRSSRRNGDREAKLVVVDYRRSMLGEFDGPNLLSYVGSGAQAGLRRLRARRGDAAAAARARRDAHAAARPQLVAGPRAARPRRRLRPRRHHDQPAGAAAALPGPGPRRRPAPVRGPAARAGRRGRCWTRCSARCGSSTSPRCCSARPGTRSSCWACGPARSRPGGGRWCTAGGGRCRSSWLARPAG